MPSLAQFSTAAIQEAHARFDTSVLTPLLLPLLAFNVTQQRLGNFLCKTPMRSAVDSMRVSCDDHHHRSELTTGWRKGLKFASFVVPATYLTRHG